MKILFLYQSSVDKYYKCLLIHLISDDLLRNLAEFVDKLMDIDDEVIELWGKPDLVQAVLEAVKQVR